MIKSQVKTLAILLGITSITFSTQAITIPLPWGFNQASTTIQLAQGRAFAEDKDDYPQGRFWQKLDLTAEQKQKMQIIKQKYQPEMSRLVQQLQAEREKLATMMQGNQSDLGLRNQHQQIISLDQKLHNLRFESMLEMRSVLTTAQRQQFAEMMDKRWANQRRWNR
jgi:Spy/CpxP family protein refolding chaperone